MSDPVSNTIIPLKHIDQMIRDIRVSRSDYLAIRAAWFGWLEETGQPHKPMQLSPGEETTMDFIDYQLSAEEKAACTPWMEAQGSNYFHLPNEVVHDGYRITFTHDEKNGCVVVTFIGRATSCPNYGKAMSTRHADIATALMMALYKQIVVFAYGSWGTTDVENLFG